MKTKVLLAVVVAGVMVTGARAVANDNMVSPEVQAKIDAERTSSPIPKTSRPVLQEGIFDAEEAPASGETFLPSNALNFVLDGHQLTVYAGWMGLDAESGAFSPDGALMIMSPFNDGERIIIPFKGGAPYRIQSWSGTVLTIKKANGDTFDYDIENDLNR